MSPMRLEFLGAAGTVTGSRTLLRFDGKIHLIDCGLFQGPKEIREKNWAPFPVEASRIESVVLTHAHLDHSGFLPRLVKEGFKGKIYCSHGTADLCSVLWLDSAKLQEEDAEYANKTGHSRHKPAYPLYKTADVKAALKLLAPQDEGSPFYLSKNLGITLCNAGHIVGANFLELSASVGQKSWTLCFSGDLGHDRSMTIRGPETPGEADLLVLESTYGDRLHDRGNGLKLLAESINQTCKRGGVLLIPAFAVGRTQEILYMIRQLEDKDMVASYPVVLDSPMAQKATELYLKNARDHKLREDFEKIDRHNFFPHDYEQAESPDESFAACMRGGPLIVISAAGMLTGGRILHHLKSRLPDENNRVLFVGHQGEGTKGRFLLEQGKSYGLLRVHHKEVEVNAEIEAINTLSAHGDQDDLVRFVETLAPSLSQIILNHGEAESSSAFQKLLKEKYPDIKCDIASEGMKVDLDESGIRVIRP